jgi:molybdopterin/thiamine biosynthesis adenylyltransferase
MIEEKKKLEFMHEEPRYHKNVLYIRPEEQDVLKKVKIVFGGVGLGSVLAESLLRLGFENFVFIDGDTVDASNLNRQNYTEAQVGSSKVAAISERLKSINTNVNIEFHNVFLEPDTVKQYLKGSDIAINAIDFDVMDTPFVFDQVCKELGIPVIHPLNFGWAAGAFLVTPDSDQIFQVEEQEDRFEFVLIEKMLAYLEKRNDIELSWFYQIIEDYKAVSNQISPPQLVVGSNLAAALTANIVFSWVTKLPVKTYPEPYFISTR